MCSKENAIEKDIGLNNLMMNFELHEFEAYLYSNPDAFSIYNKDAPETIRRIVKKADGPEYINTDPNTLPSKRLNEVITNYTNTKVRQTTKLLNQITLEQIRSQCAHFNYWLSRISEKISTNKL